MSLTTMTTSIKINFNLPEKFAEAIYESVLYKAPQKKRLFVVEIFKNILFGFRWYKNVSHIPGTAI